MARFAVGVVFGIVLTTVAGAALGSHAMAEGGAGQVVDPPSDDPEPTRVAVGEPEPAYGVWDRLAQCESGSNWASSSNPKYKGGLQEDAAFWANYGGLTYAPAPHLASRAAQIAVAERGLAVQGWGAWPVCSRRLGLR